MLKQLKQVHAYTLKNTDNITSDDGIGIAAAAVIDHTKSLICHLLQLHHHHLKLDQHGIGSGCIPYAEKLLNHTPHLHRSVFLHNKLIQAYSSLRHPFHCLRLFSLMSLRGCSPNHLSFTFLFSASASLPIPSPTPFSLHARFLKSGFASEVFALSALLDMYAKLGLLSSARQVFDEMPATHRDVPTWNSMIAGYARCGDMEGAAQLFATMPSRNVISWTAMISGYSQNGQYSDALATFLKMDEEGLRPNEVTLASVLPACANLGALEVGERIEAYARRNGYFDDNIFVSNAVLEMYGRCGKIDAARRVFDEIGASGRRNSCSWNSMIMGLAVHGRCDEVLRLYNQMQSEGIRPEDVTFVGLLLACTHGGLVEMGREIFESMGRHHGLTPKLEHYGCMVDLLGRAGRLREAYNLVQSMPMKPDSVIWGALLGACSFHGNVEIAEKAAESLVELEPSNPGNYVILSNIYASAGKWDGVARLRKTMKGGRITKAAGYSCIEYGGRVHRFIVGDRSHLRSDEIYSMLDTLLAAMKPKADAVRELQIDS
ncbi:hypothetical protein CDL15_Pgr029148 [Punica granatum]|uniref:Pentatricopeptide repeat-containing protein At5g08510 n=1 Tax=Punica granatum TaxID=22663 RepID=A0A218XKG1_PUNGR|nr:hypothetical protein CDL15_Pgr029148 [Punica granatum]